LRTAQAAMRHSTPVLTANTYTDPKLLDVARALDALPSLPLDQRPGDTSERARAVATGTYGDGAVALPVALPGDKPSKTMVSTDKTEAEPPNSLGIARLDVSSGNVSGRETMTSPVQAWFKTPGIRVTVLALLTAVGSCSGFCQSRSGGIS
jgi:hypothetical protein